MEDIAAGTERVWDRVPLDGTSIADQPGDSETAARFAARIGAASCAETLVDTAVERRLDDTTFETTVTQDVTASDDAVIIGDIDDPGSILVIEGTVVVTTTETTVETQHITETTTETYDLACVPAPPAPTDDHTTETPSAGEAAVTSLPSAGTGTAALGAGRGSSWVPPLALLAGALVVASLRQSFGRRYR